MADQIIVMGYVDRHAMAARDRTYWSFGLNMLPMQSHEICEYNFRSLAYVSDRYAPYLRPSLVVNHTCTPVVLTDRYRYTWRKYG